MLVVRHSLRATVAVRFATRSIANARIPRDDDLAIPPRTPAPKYGQHKLKYRVGQQSTDVHSPISKPKPGLLAAVGRKTTLALKYLPLDTTDDAIREALVPYGDIKAVRLVVDRHNSSVKRGYIEFYLADDAQCAAAAIDSGECMVCEMKPEAYLTGIRVASTQRTAALRVTGFGPGTSPDDLVEFFNGYAKTLHAHLGRGLREAFVDFASPEAAEVVMNAHERSPLKMQNRRLSMDYAIPTSSVRQDGAKAIKIAKVENVFFNQFRRTNPPCPSIFVSRLPRRLLTDDIKTAFGAFGEVQSVKLAYYADSAHRMNATIGFSKTAEATAAIDAWKRGELGDGLRMDYAAGAKGEENPPYHTLRIAGFSGGWKTLRRLLRPFRSLIWHTRILGGELTGPGLGVAYVEFDTVENATKIKQRLRGQQVDGNQELGVTFAKVDKDTVHRKPGGIWGQDSGGEKWSYGLGLEEARLARIKEENRLEMVKRRENLARLGAMVAYIKPPAPRPRRSRRPRMSLFDRLMRRRANKSSDVKF